MLILLLWLTSFLYVMNMEIREKWMDNIGHREQIVSCLYRVAYLVFLVGFGEGYSEHNYTLIFEMICWMVGIIMRLFIIAEIVQIVNKYNAASNKYYQRIQRLRDFMSSKGLPSATCTRILQYFDFRFQKTFYKEEEILSTLSTPLQKEIKYETCKRLIENVTIFKDLPTAVVLKLVDCLRPVIVLPNDVIVQAGTVGDNMYFIHNGTVAVYTSAGFEVCHLTDGSNFGEVSLVMKKEKRIATVVAVDSSELYILPRAAFEKVISPYPDLYNRMCKIANDRFMKTMARDTSLRDLTSS
ncbi:i[[h]] channel isoform e [Holotrichia oblita]|uniref:I[[h]] channel isoform e n=1 Tax=Holotrichia oblita TaxID=644536 RepID=A0ACB9SM36_HOLOL|nr:i[[h]] channel isoform e [Holotrichia oblita]